MTTTIIISTIFSAVIIPFFAPLLMDSLCNFYIAAMNKKNGKPTWVKGTVFYDIILANAASLGSCFIYSVSFRYVILKRITKTQGVSGYIRLKKRDLMKATVVEKARVTK
jgi:hypothetical protein